MDGGEKKVNDSFPHSPTHPRKSGPGLTVMLTVIRGCEFWDSQNITVSDQITHVAKKLVGKSLSVHSSFPSFPLITYIFTKL